MDSSGKRGSLYMRLWRLYAHMPMEHSLHAFIRLFRNLHAIVNPVLILTRASTLRSGGVDASAHPAFPLSFESVGQTQMGCRSLDPCSHRADNNARRHKCQVVLRGSSRCGPRGPSRVGSIPNPNSSALSGGILCSLYSGCRKLHIRTRNRRLNRAVEVPKRHGLPTL